MTPPTSTAAVTAEAAFAAGEDRPALRPQQRPSGAVTSVSDQITAALPLSQMSVDRVTALPEPTAVAARVRCPLAGVQDLAHSMSMPGN